MSGLSEVDNPALHRAQENLAAHEGELFLLRTREWETASGDHSDSEYFCHVTHFLGIGTPPFVSHVRPNTGYDISFATPKVAITRDFDLYDPEKIVIAKGPISSLGASSFWFGRPMGATPGHIPTAAGYPLRGRHEHDEDLHGEIIAGDDAVANFFYNQAAYEDAPPKLRELIADPETTPERRQLLIAHFINPDVLETFDVMQRGVGRVIGGMPPEHQALVAENRQKRRNEIVVEIDQILTGKVKERSLQGDPRDQLSRVLLRAKRLGMFATPFTIVSEPVPGQKVELDVPKWLRGLASRFEVDLNPRQGLRLREP